MSKESKILSVKKYSNDIGKWYDTVMKDVDKTLLFDELIAQNQNICYRCRKPIVDKNKVSVDHMMGYLNQNPQDEEKMFLNTDNLSFAHLRCNCSAGGTCNSRKNKYRGVELLKSGKARARVSYQGKTFSVGTEETEELAAELVDLTNLKYHDQEHDLNFPEKLNSYKKQILIGWFSERFERTKTLIDQGVKEFSVPAKANGKSKYRGVDLYHNPNRTIIKWRMSFNKPDGKKVTKMYELLPENELKAAQDYDLLSLEYRNGKGGLNFPEKLEEYKGILKNDIK